MSVLVYIDCNNGQIKKASFEAACYATALAKKENTSAFAIVLGEANADELNKLAAYGISKIYHDKRSLFQNFDTRAYSIAVCDAAEKAGATSVIIAFNPNGKSMAGRIAARQKASLISGATSLPENDLVQKNVFSGKAVAHVKCISAKKVIALSPNSFQISKQETAISIEEFTSSVSESDVCTKVRELRKASTTISLTEADIVVSAGRGLKGPENWGMIEELAAEMGAATACSRPVGDMHWRPHHEHVGQTGLTIRPNLYIAIGISGAIQHLAGVNGSKFIVVINSDKEAPFFKAADYGVVGDAFIIIPNLIKAYKNYKATAH